MRDDGQVVVLVAIHPAEPLRPFDVLQLGGNADLGQLRGNHFAALACVGGRGQGQRQLQRGGNTGFLEQGFGLVDVEGVDPGGVHIPQCAGYVVAADGHPKTVHCAFNHRFAVNGGGDSAAHPHIVQRFLGVVHRQNSFCA